MEPFLCSSIPGRAQSQALREGKPLGFPPSAISLPFLGHSFSSPGYYQPVLSKSLPLKFKSSLKPQHHPPHESVGRGATSAPRAILPWPRSAWVSPPHFTHYLVQSQHKSKSVAQPWQGERSKECANPGKSQDSAPSGRSQRCIPGPALQARHDQHRHLQHRRHFWLSDLIIWQSKHY